MDRAVAADTVDAVQPAVEVDNMALLRPFTWCLGLITFVYVCWTGYLKANGAPPPRAKSRANRRILSNRFVPRESLLDLAGGSILTPWLRPVAKDTIDRRWGCHPGLP